MHGHVPLYYVESLHTYWHIHIHTDGGCQPSWHAQDRCYLGYNGLRRESTVDSRWSCWGNWDWGENCECCSSQAQILRMIRFIMSVRLWACCFIVPMMIQLTWLCCVQEWGCHAKVPLDFSIGRHLVQVFPRYWQPQHNYWGKAEVIMLTAKVVTTKENLAVRGV